MQSTNVLTMITDNNISFRVRQCIEIRSIDASVRAPIGDSRLSIVSARATRSPTNIYALWAPTCVGSCMFICVWRQVVGIVMSSSLSSSSLCLCIIIQC